MFECIEYTTVTVESMGENYLVILDLSRVFLNWMKYNSVETCRMTQSFQKLTIIAENEAEKDNHAFLEQRYRYLSWMQQLREYVLISILLQQLNKADFLAM